MTLTIREVGRRGGLSTSRRHGKEHYQKLALLSNFAQDQLRLKGLDRRGRRKPKPVPAPGESG